MSEELITITPQKPPYTSMDFALLRQAGVNHIQDLAGKIWSDYNLHDPGITTLEILCYAITDLGFRTNFDMSRLLATEQGKAFEKNFHTLANIATNRPLTVNDYRKLLHDTPLVKSGWLERSDSPEFGEAINGLYEVMIELEEDVEFGNLNDNSIKGELDLTAAAGIPAKVTLDLEFPPFGTIDRIIDDIDTSSINYGHTITSGLPVSGDPFLLFIDFVITDGTTTVTVPVKVRTVSPQDAILNHSGYNTELASKLLSLDARTTFITKFLEKRAVINQTLATVWDRLRANRNLCEDFKSVEPMNLQEIGLKLDLEVTPGANLEEVLAQVFFNVDQFLSPSVRFYSLSEMLDKGLRTEEIFQGPLLDHGFIIEKELEGKIRRDIIYTSDLVQIIMDVPNVIAVKNISLCNYVYGELAGEDAKNCLKLVNPKKFVPQLSKTRSDITFHQDGQLPTTADGQLADVRFNELVALARIGAAAGGDRDLDVPLGEFANWSEYMSVMNDFPLTYSIGPDGLDADASDQRRAQAAQLKGYLMFFEQVLANYLSQLANLRDLFSFEDNSSGGDTYFSQPVYQAPDVATLLKAFTDYADSNIGVDPNNPDHFLAYINLANNTSWNPTENYFAQLEGIVESTEVFEDRRNRFMDHIMARFSESFTEYALYQYEKSGGQAPARLIKDKSRFLTDYDQTSHKRGGGFDNKSNLDDLTNESGVKTRVKRLLGFPEYTEFVQVHPSGPNFIFHIVDEDGTTILKSSSTYTSAQMETLWADAHFVIKEGRSTVTNAVSGGIYKFNIRRNTTAIATSFSTYTNSTDRNEAKDRVMWFLTRYDFRVVENTLLRPKGIGDNTLNPFIESPIDCLNYTDPYSFRINVVIPGYLNNAFIDTGNTYNYTDEDFRRLFKKTMRLETPAHIHLKFNWVEDAEYRAFEDAYRDWLLANESDPGEAGYAASTITAALNKTVTKINGGLNNLFDAEYTKAAAKYIPEYVDGELLAWPEDPDGEIVFAKVMAVDGSSSAPITLPAGVGFNTVTGEFYFIAEAGAAGGAHTYKVATFNAGGECVIHNLSLEYLANAASTLSKTTFSSTHIGDYSDNEVIATVGDINGLLEVQFKSGTSLPPGTEIHTTNGNTKVLRVKDHTKLKQGIYNIQFCATDNLGALTFFDTFQFIVGDTPSTIFWHDPQSIAYYQTGTHVLAIVMDDSDDGLVVGNVTFDYTDGSNVTLSDFGLDTITDNSTGTQRVHLRVTDGAAFKSAIEGAGSPFHFDVDAQVYHLPLVVSTEDNKGGKNRIETGMNIQKTRSANALRSAPKFYREYQVGDLLARIVAEDGGELNAVSFTSGTAPSGIALVDHSYYPGETGLQKSGGWALEISNAEEFKTLVETTFTEVEDGDQPNLVSGPVRIDVGNLGENVVNLVVNIEVELRDEFAVSDTVDGLKETAVEAGTLLGQARSTATGGITSFKYLSDQSVELTDNPYQSLGIELSLEASMEEGVAIGNSVALKVTNQSALRSGLKPGDFTLKDGVYTKSVSLRAFTPSGNEDITIDLRIEAETATTPAEVVCETPVDLSTYAVGDLLTSVIDVTDGGVAGIEIESDLDLAELGIEMTIDNKRIVRFKVSNVDDLLDGLDNGFYTETDGSYQLTANATVTDIMGGVDEVEVPIKLGMANTEPIVALYDPKPKNTYITNEVLASITDVSDNGIVSVTLETGDDTVLSAMQVAMTVEAGGIVRFRVINATSFTAAVDNVNYNFNDVTGIYSQTVQVNTTDSRGNTAGPLDVTIEVQGTAVPGSDGGGSSSGGGGSSSGGGGSSSGGGGSSSGGGGSSSGGGGDAAISAKSYCFENEGQRLDTKRNFESLLTITQSFTMVFAVRLNAWDPDLSSIYNFFFSNKVGENNFGGLRFYWDPTNGNLTANFGASNSVQASISALVDSDTTNANEWHQVAVSFAFQSLGESPTNGLNLYMNGAQLNPRTVQGTLKVDTAIPNGTSAELFGDAGTPENRLDGFANYAAIYEGVLSVEDLNQLYSNGSFSVHPNAVVDAPAGKILHALYLFDRDFHNGAFWVVNDEQGGQTGVSVGMDNTKLTDINPSSPPGSM